MAASTSHPGRRTPRRSGCGSSCRTSWPPCNRAPPTSSPPAADTTSPTSSPSWCPPRRAASAPPSGRADPSTPERTVAMPRIELDHLTKHYGAVTAVDDLSFSLEPGSITGFVGVNGAGKSTTMRMLLGLTRPTSGPASIDDRRVEELLELVDLTGAARRRVGGYSTGMRQRLGLAAALLGDPPTLVLDEPANGQDPIGIALV